MANRIYLDKTMRVELQSRFNVSTSTVSEVLNFKRTNQRSCEMRCYAVNNLNGLLLSV